GGPQGGELRRIPKATGAVGLLAQGLASPRGLTLDDEYLFAADGDGVVAIEKTGGSLLALASAANRPYGLLLVGEWLYFVGQGTDQASPLPTDGPISRVHRPPPHATTSTATPEVLYTGLGMPTRMVADETYLYWVGQIGLERAAFSGGPPQVVLDNYSLTDTP